MYRNLLILALSILVLLGLCACKKNDEVSATTMEAETEIVTEAATEAVSGVADSIFDNVEDLNNTTESTTDISDGLPQETTREMATEATESEKKNTESIESTSGTEDVSNSEPTSPTTATEPAATLPTNPDETTSNVEQTTTQQLTEYEKYNAMSGEEQMAFMQSFDTIEAFFIWYNNAKAEYEAANPVIEIGTGAIDIDEIIGK